MQTSVGPSKHKVVQSEVTIAMEFDPTCTSSMRIAQLPFGSMRMIFRSRDRPAGGALLSGRYSPLPNGGRGGSVSQTLQKHRPRFSKVTSNLGCLTCST